MFTVRVELTLVALHAMMHVLLWQERERESDKRWEHNDNARQTWNTFLSRQWFTIFPQTTGGLLVTVQCIQTSTWVWPCLEKPYSHCTAKWDQNFWIRKQYLGPFEPLVIRLCGGSHQPFTSPNTDQDLLLPMQMFKCFLFLLLQTSTFECKY